MSLLLIGAALPTCVTLALPSCECTIKWQAAMHECATVITRKGQITIPAAIRRALGLKRGDRITVGLGDGQATVKRAESVVARTAGAVKTGMPPLTAQELREAAEIAWAEEAAERNAR